MRNVKAVVEYDGTDFKGFQYQPGLPTIQGELQRVLEILVQKPVTIYGAGRTDTGVHAQGQVFNFKTDASIPTDRICYAFNSILPEAIRVVGAEEVELDFHSRFSAKSRWYRYRILNRKLDSALRNRFVWHIHKPLLIEDMTYGSELLMGINDFSSFACACEDNESFYRNLTQLSITEDGDEVLIDIRANAFLRSMVRVIVGTLVEVGLGLRLYQDIQNILEARDRKLAGNTAPAKGLCLMEVEY